MVKERTNSIWNETEFNGLREVFEGDVFYTLQNMMKHSGDSERSLERLSVIKDVYCAGKAAPKEKIEKCREYFAEACGSPLIMRDGYVDFPTSSGYRVVKGSMNNAF